MTDTPMQNGDAPILVIGGGITGISAAIEASEAGHEVYLVERNTYLGGRVVQLFQYFPKLCPPTCGVEIHLKRLRTTPRVHLLTNTRVTGVSGGPGAYSVEVTTAPRGVNGNCTNCGACVPVCPKERADAYNYGLAKTKAIHLPFGSAYPARHAIDFDVCDRAACAKCVSACAFDAIDLEDRGSKQTLSVGAVIVATGWKPYDATKLAGLGYGTAKNVVVNVEMERLAAPDGPTGGKILRPSDGAEPKTVAFVQCAGSRDELHLPHCSAVCCLAAMKQMRYVLDQYPKARVRMFYIDRRAPGRLEDFLQALEGDERATFVKGKVARITEDPATGTVTLEAEDALSAKRVGFEADLAVLAVGMVPESVDAGFPSAWKTDAQGFLLGAEMGGRSTEGAAPGVFAAGCAKRPAEVSASVKDVTGTVLKAIQTVRR